MDKVATKVNRGQPDPITNRRMSDACWDNKHFGQSVYTPTCSGWCEQRSACDKRHGDKIRDCHCSCHQVRCHCACHDPQEYKPRVKRDKHASMNILDTGCGTIEVGVSERLQRQRETLRNAPEKPETA